MIANWRELEVGKHYRLSCGCHGFVEKLRLNPSSDGESTGFVMLYTTGLSCSDKSLEDSYRKGYGPYTNFFNYSLCDEAMPAVETEAPAWWADVLRLSHFVQYQKWLNENKE